MANQLQVGQTYTIKASVNNTSTKLGAPVAATLAVSVVAAVGSQILMSQKAQYDFSAGGSHDFSFDFTVPSSAAGQVVTVVGVLSDPSGNQLGNDQGNYQVATGSPVNLGQVTFKLGSGINQYALTWKIFIERYTAPGYYDEDGQYWQPAYTAVPSGQAQYVLSGTQYIPSNGGSVSVGVLFDWNNLLNQLHLPAGQNSFVTDVITVQLFGQYAGVIMNTITSAPVTIQNGHNYIIDGNGAVHE